MSEDIYWLGFSNASGIGPKRFQLLLQTFGSAKEAWEADEKDLITVLGVALTKQFIIFRQDFSLSGYAKALESKHIAYLRHDQDAYPKLLKALQSSPFVLYIKGDVDLVSSAQKTIAIVGTRKLTEYGKEVTELLTRQLVANDFIIVSGLAIGVDSIAHQAAIEQKGKTIAVLGCGVDCCTPSINLPLYDKIVRQFGAIVSESAFGLTASKGMFPARNRIIAALSLGVVVTEGAEDSGALITAQRAKELGRHVFAVPGPITSQLSIGPHKLLQQGAKTIINATDILQEFGLQGNIVSKKQLPTGDTALEKVIITLLAQENVHFDHIVRACQNDSATIAAVLSMMEVKGMVKSMDGGIFGLK